LLRSDPKKGMRKSKGKLPEKLKGKNLGGTI